MIIKIKALDTLFFKDGKPFNKGDDTWANGIFPAYPSVIYGSIRSAYISQNRASYSIKELIEETSNLKINKIYYRVNAPITNTGKSEERVFFPIPNDLVMKKNVSDDEKYQRKKYLSYKTYKLSLSKHSSSLISSASSNMILKYHTNEEVENLENGFIDSTSLKKYIRGREEISIEGRIIEDFVTNEPKVGIGRNNHTHVTEEGLLYRVGMQRTKDIELIVDFDEIDGLDFQEKGFLKLGAETKSTVYEKETKEINLSFQSTKLTDTETDFKIYLATPAFFEKGWFPTKIFKDNKIEVELVTAALGKTINIGGYDIDKKRPKPMLKAIPAGSVYYYKLKKGSLSKLAKSIQLNSISEQREKEGFGIAYLSKV